jgi:hypothetical protein
MLSRETLEREKVVATPGMRVRVHLAPVGSTYGTLELEPGLVFKLAGLPNDARLVFCRTVQPVPDGVSTMRCRTCKAEFADAVNLGRHERSKHPKAAK